MKQKVIFFVLFAIGTSIIATLNAQTNYQLLNNGFESWESTSNTSEPTHWNSFGTSDGAFSMLASSTHHYRRDGHRPGGTGAYYLTLYTESYFGIKANGNMTTGRVHAGAMSATSEENYNYTERSNSEHSQPFVSTPDSMYVWVSYYAESGESEAQVEVILHGDNDFRAPNDLGNSSLYKARATARTTRTTSSAYEMQWQQLKVPFVYEGSSSINYVLVNMTTNREAGGGHADDSISIDDIEFIYSAWLTSISVDGEAVENFAKDVFSYTVRVSDTSQFSTAVVDCVKEVEDITLDISRERLNDSTLKVSITTTAEDGTTKQYKVFLTTSISDEPIVAIGAVDLNTFKVYPNPVEKVMNVEADGVVVINDIEGREVKKMECHGHSSVDVSTLPRGTYIVRYNGMSRKFIKY